MKQVEITTDIDLVLSYILPKYDGPVISDVYPNMFIVTDEKEKRMRLLNNEVREIISKTCDKLM